MKQLIFFFLGIVCSGKVLAQNSPIFSGGNGDGWSTNNYQQPEANIFAGGSGDGWSINGFQQPESNIFAGGVGDGWANDSASIVLSNTDTCSAAVSIVANTDTACAGSDVTFTANVINGGTAPQFQWTVNNVGVGGNTETFVSNALVSDDAVQVTLVSNACNQSQSATSNALTVEIVNAPVAGNIGGPDSVCNGVGVSFNVPFADGVAYSWLLPQGWNAAVTNANMLNANAGQTGGEISVFVSNQCGADTVTKDVFVFPLIIPVVTANDSLLTSSIAAGNQWYFDGNLINGAVGQTHIATQSGNYHVVVTNPNGCGSDTSAIVFVDLPTGLEALVSPGFAVYPNPVSKTLILHNARQRKYEYKLFDALGRELVSSVVGGETEAVDLSDANAGVYMLRIIFDANEATYLIMKQ